MINVLPFGGCGLHGPLNAVSKKHKAPSVFGAMRLKGKMFSLSANTNLQLVDFLAGDLDFPAWIKELMYGALAEKPTEDNKNLIFSCDLALVELSTPVELIFEGALLNVNRFEDAIFSRMSQLSSEKKLLSRWKSSLLRGDEEVRKGSAEQIYNLIEKDTPEREEIAKFVIGTVSRTLSIEDQTRAVADLRDRLGMPMGMILHNFSFMPDGRAVSWPAGFKEGCREVARRLDLPTYDFAPYIAEVGVKKVMLDDLRHFADAHHLALGDLMQEFCARILDGKGTQPKELVGESDHERSGEARAMGPGAKAASASAIVESAISDGSFPRIAPLPDKVEPRTGAASLDERLRQDLAEFMSEDALEEAPTPSVQRGLRFCHFDHRSGAYLPDDPSALFAVVVLGGAWANGVNGEVEDKAVSTSSAHAGGALMFNTGPRSAGQAVEAFVKLKEKSGSVAKETPCAGIADQVIQNSQSRFGRQPRMLFFTVGRRGTSLSGAGQTGEDGLLRGSVQHQDVTRLVGRARDIAASQGQRLEVAAICLLHGEYEASRNVSGSAYRRGLSLLQMQYDADIRALTGQSEPVRLYLTQTSRGASRFETPEIPIAQLNAGRDNPYIQCVGPTYFAPPEARQDGAAAYVKAVGYRRIGQVFGRFLLDDLWGGQREPLRIEEAYWTGPKTIRLRYNRAVGLEEDDARVNISALGPGLGVDFNDATPWSPIVESVRSARGREAELEVELSAPSIGPRKRLLIAARATGAGGVGCLEGPRSGIRSKEPFDIDQLDNTPLYDWACTEQVILP